MEKSFREVFNSLKLSDELFGVTEDVYIVKMGGTKDASQLKIYIKSNHIITKFQIDELAKEIKKQILKNKDVEVKFIERYNLSSTYTAKTVLSEYKDSIIAEFNELNQILFLLIKKANIDATEDTISIELQDTVIARSNAAEMKRVIETIFVERLGIPASVEIKYREKEDESRYISYVNRMIDDRIVEITKRAAQADVKKEVTEDQMLINDGETVASTEKPGKEKAKPEQPKEQAKNKEAFKTGEKKYNGGFYKPRTPEVPDDPDIFYGKSVDGVFTPIFDACDELGAFAVRARIEGIEIRDTKSGGCLFLVDISDFTDTVTMKLFTRGEEDPRTKALKDNLKKGEFIAVEGNFVFDNYSKDVSISNVVGIKKYKDFRFSRKDRAEVKRVELHCHTKLSKMDAVSSPGDVIKRAAKWGHKAIAITDHGVVQGFTEAFHALPKVKESNPDFKIIYGLEGYLVDDMIDIVINPKEATLNDDFVVFDIETTGFSPEKNNIIEIGAVKVSKGKIVDRYSVFVNPKEPIPYRITQLTGISDEMVADAPFISEILPEFLEFAKGCVLVAHNAIFDMGFIMRKAADLHISQEFSYLDTLAAARVLMPKMGKYTLDSLCKELKISLENHHRAVDDAGATAEIFVAFIEMFKNKGINTLAEVNDFGNSEEERINKIKKLRMHHIILLAANEVGRINLYRLVSMSNMKYYHIRPRIPRSELIKYREGIIVGSACEAGELYEKILDDRSEEEIRRTAEFYDYLEIQPIGNDEFLIRNPKQEKIQSFEDLRNINRKIVSLGEELGKPVVATCDAHFIDPEDEIYRRIITANEFDDADYQAPLYLRTTDEMLEEFEYLGIDKAYEVVVTNTNKICDMIEEIEPVRPDKCPPVIENSDKDLTEMCYATARKKYGDDLPEAVEARLKKELNSIISNGFAVMYIIAQKLVHKSNEDGYLVGSRGSVGSSFVATMSGITEVNPLPPHYYCTECHYSDFDSEEVKAFSGLGGCDMPDKVCPKCGAKLKKDGFDIPFETFLGFYGDKEPDIDLNFSGEYQAKAHKYTEVIFGEGHTFKAGTILTVADKTAFGYVKAYYNERGMTKRDSEIARIAKGLTDVKSGTSQHPGGIVVLPHGEEIHSFTPIQHPADKADSDMITTHFDYHSIDHNLLKLDILGHDDPTMIRRLQDLTKTDPTQVPLDDPGVMSLFKDTSALKVQPEDIGGCKLGCLGIPEFGTDFAMGMVIEAKPQAFTDLVRIAGLSHGTDVWLGNAQTLLQEGKATIATAICTRDDIMTYLMHMGLEPGDAFQIMENVRKGKVAKGGCKKWDQYKADMVAHGVPDWYIWSCQKIQYMFPKAHAVAYVMMGWGIAYYKINYPLAYYSAYFSIRADAFNYEKMCQGSKKLHFYLDDLRSRKDSLSPKEQAELKDMRIVEEMYARGFEFWPLDIFRASPDACQIIDGKIMPHIGSIDGMGLVAAEGIAKACKDGPFISRDDFRERSKVSKTITDKMYELGLLGDLPESNQLSIFDIFANGGGFFESEEAPIVEREPEEELFADGSEGYDSDMNGSDIEEFDSSDDDTDDSEE